MASYAGANTPAFVIAPGVCHTPFFFNTLVANLNHHGYEAQAVHYPTIGYHTEGKTFEDEVKSIQDVVAKYVEEQHRDVILFAHSYGGWPGSRAVKGWDKGTREAQGKKNGIIELMFMSAFLLPNDALTATYDVLPPWLTVTNDTRLPNEACVPILFNDLDPQAQQYWLSKFEPQRNSFGGKYQPNAPWDLPIPKTYIMTMDDHAATFPFQLAGLGGVINSTWTLRSIKSGHEAFLSQPHNLTKVILGKPIENDPAP